MIRLEDSLGLDRFGLNLTISQQIYFISQFQLLIMITLYQQAEKFPKTPLNCFRDDISEIA